MGDFNVIRLKCVNDRIKTIFNNMDIGKLEEQEDTSLAQKWLLDKTNFPFRSEFNFTISDVNKLPLVTIMGHSIEYEVSNLKKYFKTSSIKMSDLEMSMFMSKLADEIEAQEKLICQLELLIRGFVAKDTKKSLELLIGYLRWYSGLVNLEGNTTEDKLDPVLCFFPIDYPLGLIGHVLGCNLANKRKIILQPDIKLAAIIAVIQQTAYKLGYPTDHLISIPGGINMSFIINESIPTLIYYFDDATQEDTYYNITYCPVLSLFRTKSPMIIFNNADLDSASDCAIQAAWSQQGLMPWSVNFLLVQEDVFENVVENIKQKLQNITMGSSLNKITDFAWPIMYHNFEDILKQYVALAIKKGIDIYQSDPTNKFSPTLCLGGRIDPPNMIFDSDRLPVLTILPFRNTSEALTLAHKCHSGLAASVWTENIGLANEVAKELKFGTVWVNSHGVFKPDVSFLPHRNGGFGYIGGIQGCVQFHTPGGFFHQYASEEIDEKHIHSIATALKNKQQDWMKLTLSARHEKLMKVAFTLNEIKSDLSDGKEVALKEIDEWITLLSKPGSMASQNNTNHNTYAVKSYEEPMGVIAIDYYSDSTKVKEDNKCDSKKLLVSALAMGNAILLVSSPEQLKFIEKLCTLLGVAGSCLIKEGVLHNLCLKSQIGMTLYRNKSDWMTSVVRTTALPFNEKNGHILLTKIKNVWCNSGA